MSTNQPTQEEFNKLYQSMLITEESGRMSNLTWSPAPLNPQEDINIPSFTPLTSPALNPTVDPLFNFPIKRKSVSSPYSIPTRSSSTVPPLNLSMYYPSNNYSNLSHQPFTTNMISPALTPMMGPQHQRITPSQLLSLDQSQGDFYYNSEFDFTDNSGNPTSMNPDERKSFHKVAEQKRRDTLKNAFEGLRMNLPVGEKNSSKLMLLNQAVDYIQALRKRNADQESTIMALKQELESRR